MTNNYESPFSARYASQYMTSLFSAQTRIETWRKLWVELARAESELGLPITKEQGKMLRTRGLVEGRYPKLTISAKVAAATGRHDEYIRNKGLDNSVVKELILELLRTRPCSRAEIISALNHALPAEMTDDQKADHVSYLLQTLRRTGKIASDKKTSAGRWHIAD